MFLGIIGGTELIVIMVIALVLFGGKKIPELMRGLGKGVKEYKNAMNEIDSAEDKKNDDNTKNNESTKD